MTPIIRTASEDDKGNILELLNNVFRAQQRTDGIRGDEYWNWKYIDSPFGKSLLTIAELNEKIVGIDTLLPWEFNIRGTVLKALQPCDSVVHPDYQGRGVFTKMRLFGIQTAKKLDYNLVYNFPNSNSLHTNLSLGWHFLGKVQWQVKVLKPLNTINGLLGNAKSCPIMIDDKHIIDFDLIKHISHNTSGFDGFLKTNRIKGFHEWRYQNHPSRSYGMIHHGIGTKETVALFTLNENGKNREMVIVDLIGSKENTLPLMKMVLSAGRLMNVDFVALMNNHRFKTRELWKMGFLNRNFKNMVTLPLDLKLEEIAKDYSNWSLMAGMHDSI